MSTERLALDVERLTYGPEALAHDGGAVVFVQHAAPGDRVVAEVVERRRDYARARVVAVERAGAARVVPGCAWFPTCGGCQWQHVAPAAQRDAKAAAVAEQLARVAGLRDVTVLPTLASPGDWEYRARVALVVEGRRAGYHRARSHHLLEIDACPIADPAISAHLGAVRAWLGALRVPLVRTSVVAVPGGVAFAAVASARPGAVDHAESEDFLARTPTVRGVVVEGGGHRITAGDPTVVVPLEDDLALEVPADVFTQVNPGANRRLVATVLAFGAFGRRDRVLDLYCGAGNFSLPIARRVAAVHGVERNPLAVDAARINATRLGVGNATFAVADVTAALAAAPPPDAVVLDPPRAGARAAMDAIAALRAPRIIYVSCDPATLARDLAHVTRRGYGVARVQPVDLFPQTYHVEVVAELRLT